MDNLELTALILDYVMGRKTQTEAKARLLQCFATPSTRQAQLLAEYVEEILTQVKFGELTIDLATIGLAEMASASFV